MQVWPARVAALRPGTMRSETLRLNVEPQSYASPFDDRPCPMVEGADLLSTIAVLNGKCALLVRLRCGFRRRIPGWITISHYSPLGIVYTPRQRSRSCV